MSQLPQYSPLAVTLTHENTDQEVIVITVDRFLLAVHEHRGCLADRKEWQVPAGLLVSFVTTFFTADFKDFAGASKDTWKAFYIMATVLVTLWLLNSLWKLSKGNKLEELVDRVKKRAQ